MSIATHDGGNGGGKSRGEVGIGGDGGGGSAESVSKRGLWWLVVQLWRKTLVAGFQILRNMEAREFGLIIQSLAKHMRHLWGCLEWDLELGRGCPLEL